MRFFIFIFLFFSQTVFAHADTRKLSTTPKEIYGKNPKNIGLRISNGGAGPTGLLRALAEDYLKMSGKKYSIAWYQDISINSLKHLKNNTADIALVYEKSQSEKAQQEGWATNYTLVFNDHFLVFGPKKNPAELDKSASVTEGFLRIAEFGEKKSAKIFLSRDDDSSTNSKEKSIWKAVKIEPWKTDSTWYFKYHAFPKEALLYADRHSFYSITDWGTWLSNQKVLKNSEIYLQGGKTLLNPCFALLAKEPRKEALEFLEYLESSRAQKLIADFGKDKFDGQALFTEAAQRDFE